MAKEQPIADLPAAASLLTTVPKNDDANSSAFRFLDLPPEIRTMILSHLLANKSPIKIVGCEIIGDDWVSTTRQLRTSTSNTVHDLQILRVSEQMLYEAGSVLYGNTFQFPEISDIRLFMEGIGTMRSFVQHISIQSGALDRLGVKTLDHFTDMTCLHAFTIGYNMICDLSRRKDGRTMVERFVAKIREVVCRLHVQQQETKTTIKVLDIFKFIWDRCKNCSHISHHADCRKSKVGTCSERCMGAEKHCQELNQWLRSALTGRLGIGE